MVRRGLTAHPVEPDAAAPRFGGDGSHRGSHAVGFPAPTRTLLTRRTASGGAPPGRVGNHRPGGEIWAHRSGTTFVAPNLPAGRISAVRRRTGTRTRPWRRIGAGELPVRTAPAEAGGR
ncbi:hypothetical protein GCM10022222_76110 [Amycolatopsis ultiminotia]|uniref:Uncharacterized protein n=1 Tax=Amycolatopsis ultiminotia TaxID=543629 RepID=A0ABP6YAU4_9PSEU